MVLKVGFEKRKKIAEISENPIKVIAIVQRLAKP
jgi:hypothetical protein